MNADAYFRPDRLRFLIEQTGAGVMELGRAMGLTYPSLRHFAEGLVKPSLLSLMKMADYFGVSLDYLAGRTKDDAAGQQEALYRMYYEGLRRADYEEFLRAGRKFQTITWCMEAPWPYNLVDAVLMSQEGAPFLLTEAQERGLMQALETLKERDRTLLLEYYSGGRTYRELASAHGVSVERARQIVAKSVRLLRHPSRKNLILYGPEIAERLNPLTQKQTELEQAEAEVEALTRRREALAREVSGLEAERAEETERKERVPIEELGLSVRSYNCLKRAGLDTCGKVLEALRGGTLQRVRNLGPKCVYEIVQEMDRHGFDVRPLDLFRDGLPSNGGGA